MAETALVALSRGAVDAVVRPDEGGVLTDLRVAGRSVLASTPWADGVRGATTPAVTEFDWVERWRGGWQLCLPSAGNIDAGSRWPQGFHGVASQAPWRVVNADNDRVVLEWSDEHSLVATRTWQLTDTGAQVETAVRNAGTHTRPLVIAEHLILGGDLLVAVFQDDAELTLTPSPGAALAPLDYAGHPVGDPEPWPGPVEQRWAVVDRHTPARVAAVVDVDPRVIHIDGPHVAATVSWQGLPHALVWEELARSEEPPWNNSVIALGIEPTSAPHGMGTAIPEGSIELDPGDSLAWSVELAVRWTERPEEVPARPEEYE